MNKGIIFGFGFATGALVGGIAAYEFAKKKIQAAADEEMDRYSQYCKEKISKAEESVSDDAVEEDEEAEDDDVPVKKYRHYAGAYDSAEGGMFKERKKVITDEEISRMKSNLDKQVADANPGIEEISEDSFGKGDYDVEVLDYIFEDDQLLYGYNTDNEEPATSKYGVKDKNQIISEIWRWAPDYVDNEEEGIGSFYIRNYNLHMDFEVIVHMNTSSEDE